MLFTDLDSAFVWIGREFPQLYIGSDKVCVEKRKKPLVSQDLSAVLSGSRSLKQSTDQTTHRVNLNTQNKAELMSLAGVDANIAGRIMDRTKHNPFTDLDSA
eukprot:340675_1